MTPRERTLEALLFGHPDKIPFSPGGPREKTLKRWRREGLPEDRNWYEFLLETLGIEPEPSPTPSLQPEVNFRMSPTFEEKVLEHRDGHYIVQDWMGNITEISDEYDYTYIREARDFVTRKWHKFPVETRDDFERMKQRYRTDDPDRYPDDLDQRLAALKQRNCVVTVHFSGVFWQLREWCGFEPLCMLFLESPEFVQEMISFWADFVSRTMARVLDAGVVDVIWISEDMAYRGKSMISPAMVRTHLLPAWARWVAEGKAAGVPVFDIDSDGRIDELIPIWIEAGVNVCDPIEVAAGCDLPAYRRAFGRKMAFRGGVDKRCIARGGSVIEDELERLRPVIRDGGYIPGCDHGVPFDISWPHFVDYAGRLATLTGWLG